MNENDWVRTKNGVFTRILSLTKLHKTTMIECLNGITYTQRDIKLSSPSLLELIKNRDIVNGYRVAHVDLLTRKIIYYNDEGKEKEIPERLIETVMGWEFYKEECFKV